MAADFFSNLLDRALERAPVLQRRRLSLFEPMPDTRGFSAMPWGKSWEHGEEEPASDVKPVGIQDAPALPPTAPTPHRAAVSRPAMPMPESMRLNSVRSEETIRPVAPAGDEAKRKSRREAALPPLEQATPISVRATVPQVVETSVEVENALEQPGPAVRFVQPSEGRSVVETIVEKVVEQPKPATRSAHLSEGKTEKPTVVTLPSPLPVRPVVVPTIERDQTGETRAVRDASQQREADAALTRPAPPATPPVLLPSPRPPLPVVRSQSVLVREAPPPAPTIQVTIGRIEVRATSPSPATPKKAPSKPVAMSLEDYLKQRNEGRR